MCVRYTLHQTDEALAAIAQALARKLAPPEWARPKYTITLTSVAPVVAAVRVGTTLTRYSRSPRFPADRQSCSKQTAGLILPILRQELRAA